MVTSASHIPRHVAIIPDGNRRWARQHNLSVYDGHKQGVEIFRSVVKHAADKGIQHISVWGLSVDNFLKRRPREVAGLMKIFQAHFSSLVHDEEIHHRQICIRALGQWRRMFPARVSRAIEEAQDVTKKYKRYFCNFLLAYNGTDEMVQAIQQIVDRRSGGGPVKVTAKLIKQHLLTKELPPVDLLIRTGGEPHLSAGFMMWDTSDAQLHFTDKFWPAFTTDNFDQALVEYASRGRRFGQ